MDYFMMNPASLRLGEWEWSTEYASHQYQFTDGSGIFEGGLSGGAPVGEGSWAAQWHLRGVGERFSEQSVNVALAWPVWGANDFRVGVSFKWLHIRLGSDFSTQLNPAITALSAQSWSADIGCWGNFLPGWTWALGIRDVIQPVTSVLGEEVHQPWEIRAGLAWQVDTAWRVAVDPVYRSLGWGIAGGVEYQWVERVLAVRAGVVFMGRPGGLVGWGEASMGAGYAWSMAWGEGEIAYAFGWPMSGLVTALGTHRLALTFRQSPGTVSDDAAGTSSVTGENLFPRAPLFFTRLMPLEKELAERDQTMAQEISPVERHRHAVLTAIVAGTTAGEWAYQSILGEAPTPFDAVAFRVIHQFRYEAERGASAGILSAYEEAETLKNPHSDLALVKGWLLARQGDWRAAVAAYRNWWNGMRAGSPEPGSLHALVTVALAANDLALADAGLTSLLNLVPAQFWTKDILGRSFMARGRIQDALAAFREAEAAAVTIQERIRSKLLQAVAYSRGSDPASVDQAMMIMEEARGLAPDSPEVGEVKRQVGEDVVKRWMEEGRVSEEKLLMKEALRAYHVVLTIAPHQAQAVARAAGVQERITEQVRAHMLRAEKATDSRDLERALVEWKLVLDADSAHPKAAHEMESIFPILALKARDRVKEGLYQDAVRIYQLLEEVRPGDPAVQEGRTGLREKFSERAVRHERIEELTKAKEVWREYLEWAPGDVEAKKEMDRLDFAARDRVGAYLQEARVLEQKGEIFGAMVVVQKALRVNIASPEAVELDRRLKNQKEELLKKWTDGVKKALQENQTGTVSDLIQRILKLEPGHSQATLWLRELGEKQVKRTVEFYQAAQQVEARWDPKEALRILGQLLTVSPDHQEAKDFQRKIRERLERAEKNRSVIKELELKADIAYGQGLIGEAIKHWEQVIEWDYYNKDIRQKVEGARKEIKP